MEGLQDTSNTDQFYEKPPVNKSKGVVKKHNAIPGCSTLPSATGGSRRKRAKYEDLKRRDEVALVRREGACMRCRWTKVPVCESSVDSALS